MPKNLEKILSLLVPISVPVVICVISIAFLLSPVFMNLEYNRPGFPPDSYGFTTSDRLEFGHQTRRYLITGMSLDDLRELRFEDGEPIYIERELQHLLDVKIVLNGVFIVFWISVGVLLLAGIYSLRNDGLRLFKVILSRGGWLTTILLGVIIVLSITSFQSLFVNFHLVFFEGNSWLFKYSDTLIRLFPIQFWQDIFLVFGIFTLLGGLLVGLLFRERKD
jgi:integral membrane protein (TIGR01906 family)